MKTSIALLTLLLWISHVQGAPAVTVGQIIPVAGSITVVNVNTGTISLADGNTYVLSNASVLTVNGQRGKITDLARGFKVTGSAEIAAPDVPHSTPKRIIRMINAAVDPAAVRAAAASARSTPSRDPATVPTPAPPFTQEAKDRLTTRLGGTSWSIPAANTPDGPPTKRWLSLNADGTTTTEGSDKAGNWRVIGALMAEVVYPTDGFLSSTTVRFSPELNRAHDIRLSRGFSFMPGRPMVTNPEQFTWTLITSPGANMLPTTSSRPISGSSSTSLPPSVGSAGETQQMAAEVIKANRNNLVFVTGKQGAGSGFIADMDGANYLVTNAHVAAGINGAAFKSLDGTVVEGGAAGVAIGHDIFRRALAPGSKPFEVMKDVDQNTGVGDSVVVLGNAEGSGVINTIMGKIVGIGPNLVEIDAQFVPGNSGSPIVHLNSGKVVGVATYTVTQTYDATTREKMAAPVVRRFGYRLDSVKTWQPVNWQTFYGQAEALERVHAFTEALDDFFRDLYENKNRITKARHTNPIIKARISQWLDSKGRNHSAVDRDNADANFISFLRIACQADVTNLQRALTYDYFQRRLGQEQEIRNAMAKAFTQIIKDIRE